MNGGTKVRYFTYQTSLARHKSRMCMLQLVEPLHMLGRSGQICLGLRSGVGEIMGKTTLLIESISSTVAGGRAWRVKSNATERTERRVSDRKLHPGTKAGAP